MPQQVIFIKNLSPSSSSKCPLSLERNVFLYLIISHVSAVVLYYEVLRLGSGYDRIDAVFDRYFDRSLKEATQISRGTGTRFKITEFSEIPKNFERFLNTSQNKNDLNEYPAEKFIRMHHENQVLVCTYRETNLPSHQGEIENNSEFSIIACQSKEDDQRLIPHTLLSPCFSYEKIVSIPIRYHLKEFKCFSLC